MTSPDATGTQAALHCLGIGDGWPSPDRRHSSYLYRFGTTSLLVDCGDGLNTGFAADGLKYDELDAVLLSHLHSDHVGGFSLFVQDLWLERRRRQLPVHLPGSGIAPLKAWLDATILPPALIGFPIRWVPLRAGRKFRAGAVSVTAFPTTHLESLRRALQPRYPHIGFEAFSFLLEAPGVRIAHTADLGAASDLVPLVANPLDLLVCELAHVELEHLAAMLRGRPIGRIVFMHVAREFWQDRPGTRRRLKAALGPIPFTFARDGDRFSV
jgi:ribonuclease Z